MADAKRGGLSRRRGVKTRAEQGRGFTLKERVTPLLAERGLGRRRESALQEQRRRESGGLLQWQTQKGVASLRRVRG
jgi:hypothetical protein